MNTHSGDATPVSGDVEVRTANALIKALGVFLEFYRSEEVDNFKTLTSTIWPSIFFYILLHIIT